MHSKYKLSFLVVVTFLLIVTSAAVSRPRKMQRLSSGTWGGPGIRMDVDASSARIEYACANGTITGPLTMDSKGRFSWRGTHERERPGPVRLGQDSAGAAATYKGSVNATTMTLTVTVAGIAEPIGTFTLRKGGAAKIFKCR